MCLLTTNVSLPVLIIKTPASGGRGNEEYYWNSAVGAFSSRDLCVCYMSHQPGTWILMQGFHWNSAADRQAPQDLSRIIFVSVITMHDLHRDCTITVESSALFCVFRLIQIDWDEGKKEGETGRKEVRQKAGENKRRMGSDKFSPTLFENSKVKLWFISRLHSSLSLHYLWTSLIHHMTPQTCQNITSSK